MLINRNFLNWSVGGAVLLGAALSFILGPDRISRETRAAVQRVEEAIDRNVSNAQLVANARVILSDYDQYTTKLEENLHELDERIAESQGIIKQAEDEQRQHEDVLRLAKVKLASDADSFVINGRAYSRQAVEQDVSERLKDTDSATTRIASQREVLAALEQIKAETQNNLREARAQRSEKARELELLTARLQNAEVLEHVQSLHVKFDPATGERSKFSQAVGEIERRIRDANRRIARSSGSGADRIDWLSKPRDLVAEIDARLKSSTPTTPTTSTVAKK